MPMQTGQSQLLKNLGQRGAQLLDQHKGKEPDLPNMGLPAGIENGVAQVRDCKFGVVQPGKRNAGAIYYMGQAVVKLPREHNGVRVAGQRTMVYKEITDPQGKINEKNLLFAQDQLKMLVGRGADPQMFALVNLEATAALVLKARPYTLFRTWKGDKQDVRLLNAEAAAGHRVKPGWWLCSLTAEGSIKAPVDGKGPYASEEAARKVNPYAGREPMVNHQWGGVVEYQEENGPDTSAVSYNGRAGTDTRAAAEGFPSAEETPSSEPFNELESSVPEEEEEEEDDEPTGEEGEEDLDVMAQEAYQNAIVQKQLSDLALESGVGEEDVTAAEKWEEVVALIRAARERAEEGAGAPGQEADRPWKPVKGEVCFYRPRLPNGKPQLGKNKKPLQIEVEVLASDPKNSRCNVKDLATKKPILGTNKKPLAISWEDLTPPE